MSNDYSFERNRYFTGKLLTAQDFIAEQKYLSQKRNLLNRALFGMGIVCGLTVIKADESSIAVEPGLALDAEGREVLVPQAAVAKLGHIDGFDGIKGGEGLQKAYLCLEYRERPAEPVYSVSRDAAHEDTGEPEHNKIREGWALRLVTEEPQGAANAHGALCETLLWDCDGVRVTMTVPRFVGADGECLLETRVSRGASRRAVSFSCELDLRFLDCGGEQRVSVCVDAPADSENGCVCQRTVLRARPPASREAQIRVHGASVTVGGHCTAIDIPEALTIGIADDRQTALLSEMWDRPLNEGNGPCGMLYLARLQLIVSPPYVSIEHIENRPFGQMVLSAAQSLELLRAAALARQGPPQPPAPPDWLADRASHAARPRVKTGTAHVSIPYGARKGEVVTSVPIPHGLGIGTVFVAAHLMADGQMLSVGGSIFKAPCDWGVRVNRDDGTFTIAVQTLDDCGGTLEFCWRAEELPEERADGPVRLSLRPAIAYISARQSVQFDAVLSDGSGWRQGELNWAVDSPEGGRVDQAGLFTAFDKPGIYEIKAHSAVDAAVSASAFVVVK